MDKASDYESGDSRFESWQGRFFPFVFFLPPFGPPSLPLPSLSFRLQALILDSFSIPFLGAWEILNLNKTELKENRQGVRKFNVLLLSYLNDYTC